VLSNRSARGPGLCSAASTWNVPSGMGFAVVFDGSNPQLALEAGGP